MTNPPATKDAKRPAEEEGARSDTLAGRPPDPAHEFGARFWEHARKAARFLWRHVRRLSLHGVPATRPLEIGLRATGLAVGIFAPLWPLFGSIPDGWWDWILTTVANLGIGFALFGAGETVRRIDEVHREIVAARQGAAVGGEASP